MNITILSLATILCIRIFAVLAIHIDSLRYVYFDHSYHLYYGLGILVLLVSLKKFIPVTLRYLAFGVSAGMIVDDVGVIKYIIYGNPLNPIEVYWSALFILPMITGLILIAVFENKIKEALLR